jgi:hypothetical protein
MVEYELEEPASAPFAIWQGTRAKPRYLLTGITIKFLKLSRTTREPSEHVLLEGRPTGASAYSTAEVGCS